MKYKLTGIALCFILIIISIMAPVIQNSGQFKDRYIQHESAKLKNEDEVKEGKFNTHLPIVVIDTFGEEIPGKVVSKIIVDKNGVEKVHHIWGDNGYYLTTKTKEGYEELRSSLKVIDNENQVNYPDDTPSLTSLMTIKVRGNSSRVFDKSSYRINLITEDGENNNQKVMGMDAHHEWVLYGPYLDKTLIRNYMWYNIGGLLLDYAPNVRFCEVILNGEYQGVYVMMENITGGKGAGRLNLSISKKHNKFYGYLLKLDRGTTGIKSLNNFTVYTYQSTHRMEIVYPKGDTLTEKMARDIALDFSKFEKALYSYDFDSAEYGYENYIDVQSFVDWFLINEVTSNYDAGWNSTFIYKDLSGRYKMTIWDYNSASDNYQDNQLMNEFQMQGVTWYKMLCKDEKFISKIIARYRYLRQNIFSDEYLMSFIDNTIDYLGDSVDRNYEVWGSVYDRDHDLLKPAERNPRSYEEAVEQMKNTLLIRVHWMDENIDTLKQYCADSKIKKFTEAND